MFKKCFTLIAIFCMNHQAPQHLYVFSLGVAQLINKKEGKVFDEYDEQLFEVTIFLRC